MTWLFFPSPTCGRWENMPPINLRRIWLVRPRPHAKYTREVYLYIPGSGHYVNPSWAQQLWSNLILTTSCVDVIITGIRSVINHETPPSMIRGMWTSYVYYIYIFIQPLSKKGASRCEENYIVIKKFTCTTDINIRQGISVYLIIYSVPIFNPIQKYIRNVKGLGGNNFYVL